MSSSLVAALAQRLVRKLCSNCGSALVGLNESGCDSCRNGYRGRIGIFELLVLNDQIRRLVESRASAAEIRQEALSNGMPVLRRDGLNKVSAGTTTREEVERVASLGDADREQL